MTITEDAPVITQPAATIGHFAPDKVAIPLQVLCEEETFRSVRLKVAIHVLGGLTPDGIADLFRSVGITGYPNDPLYCPVATFLRPYGDRPVMAGTHTITDHRVFGTPRSVREFIERFDAGAYSDLAR